MIDDSVMLVVQRYDAEKRQMYGKILSKRQKLWAFADSSLQTPTFSNTCICYQYFREPSLLLNNTLYRVGTNAKDYG